MARLAVKYPDPTRPGQHYFASGILLGRLDDHGYEVTLDSPNAVGIKEDLTRFDSTFFVGETVQMQQDGVVYKGVIAAFAVNGAWIRWMHAGAQFVGVEEMSK